MSSSKLTEDDVIIMASDGLWERLSSEKVRLLIFYGPLKCFNLLCENKRTWLQCTFSFFFFPDSFQAAELVMETFSKVPKDDKRR